MSNPSPAPGVIVKPAGGGDQPPGRKGAATMKHYTGERTPEGCDVMVLDVTHEGGGYPLAPRHDLRNHSPAGFGWGYAGSGPGQLALAILADALGDDALANKLHVDFKNKVISRLDGDNWTMSEEDVRLAVAELATAKAR